MAADVRQEVSTWLCLHDVSCARYQLSGQCNDFQTYSWLKPQPSPNTTLGVAVIVRYVHLRLTLWKVRGYRERCGRSGGEGGREGEAWFVVNMFGARTEVQPTIALVR